MAATLLELTQQGDVATITDESRLDKIKLLSPQQLYELWERQQWLSQEIDFTQDREDWVNLTDEERDRFYREVVGMADSDIQARLARVRENVNDAFVKLFDVELVEAGRRLIADPSNLEAKVDFVTAYHMVIEGTLALTGQWTITDYWEKTGKMPGFLEGFKNVARDEHRHVAYGTWYLKQACAKSGALADRVRTTLQELLPIASGVLVPPGQDPNDWELLGYTSEQVNSFAFTALTRRLKVIGVSLVAPEPAAA